MKKLESIDLVRSFAVLSVLGCHWAGTHLVSAEGLPPWLQWAWSKVAYNGALGVPAFFLVSGFLITRLLAQSPGGLDKPNLRFFYSRRVGRIVPLYVLTLLVCMLLLFVVPPLDPSSFRANLQISHDPLEPLFWISLMTFTLNWFTTLFSAQHPFGGAWGILWSICIEEQFYLFYPLLLRVVKGRRELAQLLGFFILFGLATRFTNLWFYPDVISYNSFQSFDQIAMGALLYLVWDRWGKRLGRNKDLCLFLAALGTLTCVLVYTHIPSGPELAWYLGNRFFFCLGLFLLLLGCLSRGWLEGDIFHRLSLPGRLSYGLYMFHVLVIYVAGNFLAHWGLVGSITWFIALSLVTAYFSYHYFEMPMNYWLRNKINPPRKG